MNDEWKWWWWWWKCGEWCGTRLEQMANCMQRPWVCMKHNSTNVKSAVWQSKPPITWLHRDHQTVDKHRLNTCALHQQTLNNPGLSCAILCCVLSGPRSVLPVFVENVLLVLWLTSLTGEHSNPSVEQYCSCCAMTAERRWMEETGCSFSMQG